MVQTVCVLWSALIGAIAVRFGGLIGRIVRLALQVGTERAGHVLCP